MAAKQSNLQCFLDSITPSVESHFLFKSPHNFQNSIWHQCGEANFVEYFTLSDMWDSLLEWSVYGVGTDVVLPSGETVIQYFAPYLSAIQLYTTTSFLTTPRGFGFDNGEEYWYGNGYSNWQLSQPRSILPIDPVSGKMDLGNAKKIKGDMYFQYFEMASPFTRVPLVDKVRELSRNFPGLECLKSVELSPASWMSIAWYPIYTIPAKLDRDTFGACFLTYHSLASSFQDAIHQTLNVVPKLPNCTSKEPLLSRNKVKQNDEFMTISLPPFGLATLKANETLWKNPETGDGALAASLLYAANCWLRKLQAHHNDFNFFVTH